MNILVGQKKIGMRWKRERDLKGWLSTSNRENRKRQREIGYKERDTHQ